MENTGPNTTEAGACPPPPSELDIILATILAEHPLAKILFGMIWYVRRANLSHNAEALQRCLAELDASAFDTNYYDRPPHALATQAEVARLRAEFADSEKQWVKHFEHEERKETLTRAEIDAILACLRGEPIDSIDSRGDAQMDARAKEAYQLAANMLAAREKGPAPLSAFFAQAMAKDQETTNGDGWSYVAWLHELCTIVASIFGGTIRMRDGQRFAKTEVRLPIAELAPFFQSSLDELPADRQRAMYHGLVRAAAVLLGMVDALGMKEMGEKVDGLKSLVEILKEPMPPIAGDGEKTEPARHGSHHAVYFEGYRARVAAEGHLRAERLDVRPIMSNPHLNTLLESPWRSGWRAADADLRGAPSGS
jgi:hypothetical protein